MIFQIVAAFFSLALLDFVWAYYTRAVVAKRPASASAYAAVITVLNGGAAIMYVATPILLLPAAAGAFVGTWLALRWGNS